MLSRVSLLLPLLAGPCLMADTTVRGSVSVKLETPVVMREAQALCFGVLSPHESNAGSIKVTANGRATLTHVITANNTATTGAKFDISGGAGSRVQFTIPRSTVTLDNGSGQSLSMTFDHVVQGTNNTNSVLPFAITLDSNGKASVALGATLTVPSGQARGTYTGHYDVVVAHL